MVEILNKPASLSSERYVSLTCVSEGSRPPAQLTWFKDNRKFKKGKVNISPHGFSSNYRYYKFYFIYHIRKIYRVT